MHVGRRSRHVRNWEVGRRMRVVTVVVAIAGVVGVRIATAPIIASPSPIVPVSTLLLLQVLNSTGYHVVVDVLIQQRWNRPVAIASSSAQQWVPLGDAIV
uniref:(northern house mosquito) hypothetical protein n=1 Tax=Culex pipiens TaxID=7175 RepID=A0A8D8N416_CULPI